MIDYASVAFQSVYVCALFHNYGKLDKLKVGWPVSEDAYVQLIYEGLECVSGKLWVEELDMAYKVYLSDPAMMEYYRLCREYCRDFGVSLKQNPFMTKAALHVRKMLDIHAYDYGWTLQDKINHEWASGIVFCHGQYFDSHLEAIEALLEIFWFYETELEVLKKALAERKTTKEAA